jgi:hypothetical protein
MVIPVLIKDPAAELDYGFDWGMDGWLATGETITTSTWTVAAGLTQTSSGISGGKVATVWLSGGVAGTDYLVTNRIVTDGGRTDERSLTIRVRQR